MYALSLKNVAKKGLERFKMEQKSYKNCHFFNLGTRISLALYFDAEST